MRPKTSEVIDLAIAYITSVLDVDPNLTKIDYKEELDFEFLVVTGPSLTLGRITERAIYEDTGFQLILIEFQYELGSLTFKRALVKDPLA